MLTIHPHTKKLTELSLKQRQQVIAYSYDTAIRQWPTLTISSPRPRADTPRPKSPRCQSEQ